MYTIEAGLLLSAHLYVRCMMGGCLLGDSDCGLGCVAVDEAGGNCQWQWIQSCKGSGMVWGEWEGEESEVWLRAADRI